MLSFTPYENPTYFVILGIALIPLVIGLLYGKRSHLYETLVSLAFLLLTFGGPKWSTQGVALVVYIIFEMLLTWGYSVYRKRGQNKGYIFYFAVILAILPLTIVKVTPAVDGGNNSLIGFLGISYLTFRAVQTIMEIRDGTIKNFSLKIFIPFMLFFPTISSGPIDRYRRFEGDFTTVPDQDKYLKMLGKGLHYIFLGFLYKFLLAYFFGTILMPKLAHTAMIHRGGFLDLSWSVLGYMYCYSADLFFDFAGYSLFAVGISYFMGIETPMNFNRPWQSKNIKDFWNRWHITLSFWFRDFIFMRLVFWFMKHKTFKKPTTTSNVVYFINMGIMGFWHGVTWFYITYGLFHAAALIINDAWLRYKKKHQDSIPHNKFTEYFAIFFTANVVCFSFLIFSGFLNTLWFTK
ncbi:D-alanyl-lipoteichoic acid biosynthesis protein DltB [Levilactobacillus bambusae]|uniref:Teichoic acid D-alanyltransferase n=1 Tax=Levilactobacillus bambusae TaxID=2024736 RepID=A0A2V1N3W6_9LACO|nr:D-alanyl-lipoteichoic acid biosynthesis protein DltB [Levilactobacillus bambusae]PWG00745.1 D-alanyl-lipoteichoic acid biosynthesis protein DltB [Levilactobacillus bambusae]